MGLMGYLKRVQSGTTGTGKTANPKSGSKFVKRKKRKTDGSDSNRVDKNLKEESEVEEQGCCSRARNIKLRKDWYTSQDIKLPFIIQILSKYSLAWEFILYFVVIIQYCYTTYGSFFTSLDYVLWERVYVCDFIYVLDVLMRLSVEIWRHQKQSAILVFTLPYRFLHGILDLVSLFPLYSLYALLTSALGDSFDHLSYLDFFKLTSYIRIYRAFLFFDILEARKFLSEEALFLMRFANLYLLFINCVACLFFTLTYTKPIDFLLWRNLEVIDTSWAKFFNRKKPNYGQNPGDLYTLTLHFSTATVTTVGFGDFHGETELEMICCVVIMLIGAIFLNGYFTSQITNFQLELDGARFDLFYRLSGIKSHLIESGMSDFFQSKVELYYKCLWTYREGVDKVIFVDHLPRSLLEDVYYDICTEMFHKSYLFRDLDEAFLRAVSKIMKISLYNPDMILCRYGGYANQMFYILQGECQAMSKHEASKRAAVLRAGSIIGETNLFFSCPYTISVETNTCCQFISIDKEELMQVFNKFPTELNILRTRSQQKIMQMYKYFQIFGEDPVCWVQKRQVLEDDSDSQDKLADSLANGTVGRWGDGLNFSVNDDVIADADRFVIFETMCQNKKLKKDHVTPYMTCVVPEILNSKLTLIVYWNRIIIVFALIYCFVGPFCYSFGAASHLEQYICRASHIFEYVNEFMYFFDVIMEVVGACPVEGFYYRFQDGLKVKCREVMFYFDILAAIPVELFPGQEHDIWHFLNVILKSIKLRKVIRYLKFLDNIFPKDLFWFRLGQTFLVLMYGIHFIACFMFSLACPTLDPDEDSDSLHEHGDIYCNDNGWIASYKTAADFNNVPVEPELEPSALSKQYPYLLSFYFATATLTSAGFGDFNPQNDEEIIFVMFFQLIGFFIIGYYTALLTSALACVVKPRLEFQQRLLAIKRFMSYYVLPEILQRRVVEHYELQHQFRNGVNLPKNENHYLFDSPDYIKHDVLYSDVVLILDGIPLFSKTDSKNIIKMSELMKRYLIPPNIKFLHIGEVRRSMYAIRFGSIGVFDGRSELPQSILESTAYFGLRDLLLGEPSHYDYITLSYCVLYEISNEHFMEVFEEDDELQDFLEKHRKDMKRHVEAMCRTYSHIERERKTDQAVEIPSFIIFKPSNTDKRLQAKYSEYLEYFKEFRCGRFFKFFLMNRVIHPAGLFSRLWTSLISLVACMTVCLLVMETFMYIRTPRFRFAQWALDGFLYMDIYVRLHWAYHLPDGLIVTHPVKTAGLYVLEGSFIYDVVALAHPEFLMFVFGFTNIFGYGEGATWYTKLRWLRFMQIKRVPQIFDIIHTIFVWRNAILFVLYVSMTLVVCTLVAAIALAIGCPWSANDWSEGDEYKLPFCLDNTWATKKGDDDLSGTSTNMADFTSRWTVGVYYVCSVILVIGFGDMITLNTPEVKLLIFMCVFGFIFMRCIVADITAAEVDSDEIRSRFIDRMKRLVQIMTREKVGNKMIKNVKEHLEHTWKQTKGLEPHELFSDLHPALEADLYRAYVGNKLNKVPVFQDFAPNVVRSLCKYARKVFFLTGERLSRCGNLEYDMFIITQGKVWVTDRLLNYGCTLHKNESFGETGIVCHLPRKYTVIAAENTEVFVISQVHFAIIINRYPVVKDLINIRTGNGQYDFFEHKIYDMIEFLKGLSGVEKDRRIDVLVARTQVIKHFVYAREDPEDDDEAAKKKLSQKKKYSFISYGSDDDNLPFIYFISQRSRKTGKFTLFPPLIHPNCTLMRWYLKMIYIIFFFFPAITVYEVCFPPDKYASGRDIVTEVVQAVSSNIQYIMLLYVFLNFMMPYEDSEGNFVKSSGSAAMNYAMAPTGMFLDLAAAIPPIFCPSPSSQDDINYFRLSAVIWLYRYYAHHLSKRDDLSISAFQFKITLSVSSFCLMAHVLACIFYAISHCSTVDVTGIYKCKTNTWTEEFVASRDIEQPETKRPWRWWVRALYWVVTCISTTGFGDIIPNDVGEMTIGIICVFCGAFILSIILSHFTAGMASLTKAKREYLYQVKLLVKYLRNIGLSNLRQDQIHLYFDVVWKNCRGGLYHNAMEILPSSMQIDVSYALFHPVLSQVKFFNIAEKSFIRQVAARVTHSIYLPGICIVKEGDQGNLLYIVYKGRVSGIVEGNEFENELRSVYLVGDVFGKFPALFHEEWYKKSYRAEEYTEVLAISQHDIMHLASIYEEFWKILITYVEKKYEPHGDADCVFAETRTKAEFFDFGFEYSAKNAKLRELKDKQHRHKHDKRTDKKVRKVHHHSMVMLSNESVQEPIKIQSTSDVTNPPMIQVMPEVKETRLQSVAAERFKNDLLPWNNKVLEIQEQSIDIPQEVDMKEDSMPPNDDDDNIINKKRKIKSSKKLPRKSLSEKSKEIRSKKKSLVTFKNKNSTETTRSKKPKKLKTKSQKLTEAIVTIQDPITQLYIRDRRRSEIVKKRKSLLKSESSNSNAPKKDVAGVVTTTDDNKLIIPTKSKKYASSKNPRGRTGSKKPISKPNPSVTLKKSKK